MEFNIKRTLIQHQIKLVEIGFIIFINLSVFLYFLYHIIFLYIYIYLTVG